MRVSPRRRSSAFAFPIVVGIALIVSAAANTQTPREEQGGGLRAQAPRDEKQAKLDSRLAGVASAAESRGNAAALTVARSKGLRVKNGKVRVVVVARDRGNAEDAAKGRGGAVEGRHGDKLQVLLPPAALDALSKNPNVEYVRPPLEPSADAVAGEGVGATSAAPWIAAGRKGAGVKVAIIDLGFAGYTQRQTEGDLPASLTTVDLCNGEFATVEPHGTAVAEIVHEMAPDAALTLICIDSEVSLGQAVDYAIANGIKVINHSVGWFNAVRGDGKGGAGTIDGMVSAARAAGILWVNSAGNQAQDHWNAAFNDTNANGAHNYSTTDEGNTFLVPAGGVACVYLKWDAWPVTNQDFDLYLARSADGELFAASTSLQNGSQTPTEAACFVNPSGFDDWFFAVVDRFAATAKPRLDMVVHGGYFLQYQSAASSINELAASPDTLAVAAICWQTNALEPFSSRGPTIDNRVKPDISGQDGVSNATYGPAAGCGGGGFLGTSAAAPHVAGAAALVLGQNPSYSVTQLQAALTGAAVDLGAAGKDNSFGSGRLRVPLMKAPTISTLTPGAATAQASVVIAGSNLNGATSVTFNGVAATYTINSSTQITAKVPPTATPGPVAVTTPDGFVQSAATFKPVPKLTLATPNPAQVTDALTVTGTNLTGATALKLGTTSL
ncbi:MAG: S8 family serine peptidase, partial [Gaiellaceae bacterium]